MLTSKTTPLSLTSDSTAIEQDLASPTLTINCNNQSAIKLAKNSIFHARTKHIEVYHHFVKKEVEFGETKLDCVSTDAQSADIFMKSLNKLKFELYRSKLGFTSLSMLSN